MRRNAPRLIDPANDPMAGTDHRLGIPSPHELLARIAELERVVGRLNDEGIRLRNRALNAPDSSFAVSQILAASIGPWYRENVPANTADVTFRLLAIMTSSTNPASANALYNSSAGGGASIVANQPLRVIGGVLHTPSTITAGSATLGVRVGASTFHYFSDCVLNATNTIGVMSRVSGRGGALVQAGELFTPVVQTSSGWLPTSADLQATLFVAWEEPT